MAKRRISRALENKLQRAINEVSLLTMDACKAKHRRENVKKAIACSDALDGDVERFGNRLRKKLGLPKVQKF